MSGIKMTSIFGTIINSCICKAICWQTDVRYNYMLALGDDLDLQIMSVDDADKVIDYYKNIGIEVSKQKTSISQGSVLWTEFLW